MTKDIGWLKREIDELYISTFNAYDAANGVEDHVLERECISRLSLISKIYDMANQLDEPKALTQEWIDKNTSPADDKGRLYVWENDLQNIIIYEPSPTKEQEWLKGEASSTLANLENLGYFPESVGDIIYTEIEKHINQLGEPIEEDNQ